VGKTRTHNLMIVDQHPEPLELLSHIMQDSGSQRATALFLEKMP